jgi:hypothetical protein
MKSLAVSLFISTVAAVRRMQEEKKDFIETKGFLVIVIIVGVLMLCFLCCGTCSVRNKSWVNA